MDPWDLEFFAEGTLVNVYPNFGEQNVILLSGEIGPFQPGLSLMVPLWVGVNLKQRRKCRIECPGWMEVERLSEHKDIEKRMEVFARPPHPHYIEVASQLLKWARDDIPNASEVGILVRDIMDIRAAKLRKSLHYMFGKIEIFTKVDNVTSVEINNVKRFLLESMTTLEYMRSNLNASE